MDDTRVDVMSTDEIVRRYARLRNAAVGVLDMWDKPGTVGNEAGDFAKTKRAIAELRAAIYMPKRVPSR